MDSYDYKEGLAEEGVRTHFPAGLVGPTLENLQLRLESAFQQGRLSGTREAYGVFQNGLRVLTRPIGVDIPFTTQERLIYNLAHRDIQCEWCDWKTCVDAIDEKVIASGVFTCKQAKDTKLHLYLCPKCHGSLLIVTEEPDGETWMTHSLLAP